MKFYKVIYRDKYKRLRLSMMVQADCDKNAKKIIKDRGKGTVKPKYAIIA